MKKLLSIALVFRLWHLVKCTHVLNNDMHGMDFMMTQSKQHFAIPSRFFISFRKATRKLLSL